MYEFDFKLFVKVFIYTMVFLFLISAVFAGCKQEKEIKDLKQDQQKTIEQLWEEADDCKCKCE